MYIAKYTGYIKLKLHRCRDVFIFTLLLQPALIAQTIQTLDSLRRSYEEQTNLIQKADAYYDWVKAIQNRNIELLPFCSDTLEKMSKSIRYQKGLAMALNLKGWYYSEKGNYDSATIMYRRDLNVRINIKDTLGVAAVYNNMGANFREAFQPDSAILYQLKAIDINEQLKNYKNLASGYANLGNLFSDQKLHNKAVEYLKKALHLRLQQGDEKGAVFTYNNLTVAFGAGDQLDSALYYAQKGTALALKYENFFVAGVIIGGVSHLYNEQGKHKEAIPYAEQSLQYLSKVNRKANMVFPYVNLAKAYNRLNEPRRALQYGLIGYKIMDELKLLAPLEVYYEEIAKSYELLGKDHESLIWFKKFMQLDDSLFKAENNKSLADTEAKYQNLKKEAEIGKQKLDINNQNNRLFQQRTWIFALIFGLFALGLFSILYFQRYRLKKRIELDAAMIKEQKQGLEAVIEAQEEERTRIAKDLHDGVAQELVALKLGFSLLDHKIKNQSPIQSNTIQDLLSQLDDTTQGVRNMAHQMVPPTLERQGLGPTLELLLANTLKNAGVDYQFNIEGLNKEIHDKIKIGIYRIAQEILNNVIKHSHAKQVLFYLTLTGNTLTLKVQDDGQGFNEQTLKTQSSMGLLNIISRVATLGGSYSFENIQPHGTYSVITIPI